MPTLRIAEIPNDDQFLFNPGVLPTAEDGDLVVFGRQMDGDDGDFNLRYYISGTGQGFRRTKVGTLWQHGSQFSAAEAITAENLVPNVVVYQIDTSLNVRRSINLILTEILQESNEDDNDNIDEAIGKLTDGGRFEMRLMNESGTVQAIRAIDLPALAIDWNANDKPGIEKLLSDLIPLIEYDGFNPKHTRKVWLSKFTMSGGARITGVNELKAAILKCVKATLLVFAAYSHIGNRITNLTKRRVDIDVGAALMGKINEMGIKKANRVKDGLTLPRVVSSFLDVYLLFRKHMVKGLQTQTDSEIDVIYQDILFYGCPGIRAKQGYESFHIQFSSYIHKNRNKEGFDHTDKTFLKDYKQWNKVIINGFMSDDLLKNSMTSALEYTPDATVPTRNDPFDEIVARLTAYYIESIAP